MVFPKSLALAALLGATTVLHAAESAPAAANEARLRDALRSATLQLRDAQGKVSETQAALDEKTAEAAGLKKKSDALAKQGAADRDASAKKVAGLEDTVAKRDAELAKYKDLAAKWKEAAEKNAEIARTVDAERARLAALSDRLTVRVADREAQNVKLVTLANEILKRFEKFGMGEAIANREPFIGTKRVELQTLVQDYGDKIADRKVKPGAPAPGEAAGTAK